MLLLVFQDCLVAKRVVHTKLNLRHPFPLEHPELKYLSDLLLVESPDKIRSYAPESQAAVVFLHRMDCVDGLPPAHVLVELIVKLDRSRLIIAHSFSILEKVILKSNVCPIFLPFY